MPNTHLKGVTKMLRTLTAGAALLLLAVPAAAQEMYEYPATISSTGHGIASAEPDMATIVFGVDLKRREPGEAVDEAAILMEEAMAAARAEGVAGEDLSTTSYNLWVEQIWDDYTYEYTGEMEYHVTHYATAVVRDLDSVGDVLSALVEGGANTISSVTFGVEDTSDLYAEARQTAAANAAAKAEQLADGFGLELGRVTGISEWTNDYYYQDYGYSYANYGAGAGYGGEVPPVTPGAFRVGIEVSVTYELEQ